MNIQVIDNISSLENHKNYILEMIKNSDELILTSPFLMQDLTSFFNNEIISYLKKIEVITTMKPNTLDQLKKYYSLKSLIEIPEIKTGTVACTISLNNKLHGKIYIFKKSGDYIGGILSSANFTDNGLWINHEWGVSFKDKETLFNLETSILNAVEPDFKDISHKSILDLKCHINSFEGNHSDLEEKEIDLDLTEFLEQRKSENGSNDNKNSTSSNRTYEYKITPQYLEAWQSNFEEYVEFKTQKNEVTVPRDYKNPSLYLWYRKQKIFNANETIPPEHKAKLEEVGFYFGDGHEIRWAKIWEEHYGFLKAYYEEYGNSDVPHTPDNKDVFYTLGNWVAIQKTYFNNNVLSDYKIEKLNELDFIWQKTAEFNPRNKIWMERYEELKQWTEKHGDAHVPQVNEDGTQNKLGRWLNDQRHLKRKGRKRADGTIRYLEDERVNLLLEIGVDFDHEENKHIDAFEKQIQEFLSYRFQHPALNPPSGTFKTERDNLAQWRHKFKKLPEWKQKRLIELKIIE
jgi:HKD family nuclease